MTSDDAVFQRGMTFALNFAFGNGPLVAQDHSEEDEKLVEYGFLRYAEVRSGAIGAVGDEPLPMLALAHYYKTEAKIASRYFLQQYLSIPNVISDGLAYRNLVAFLLVAAFQDMRPLREVFRFVCPHDLENKSAMMVGLERDSPEWLFHTPKSLTTVDPVAMYKLGSMASSAEETFAWLKNPQRTAFCFPADGMGPGLILLLLLSDGSLLRVLLETEQLMRKNPAIGDVIEAFQKTDPESFISQLSVELGNSEASVQAVGVDEEKKTLIADKSTKLRNIEEIRATLTQLGPTARTKAGNLGVLRTVLSNGPLEHEADLVDLVNRDEGHHPGAAMDLISLHSLLDEQTQCQLVESLVSAVVAVVHSNGRRALAQGEKAEAEPQN